MVVPDDGRNSPFQGRVLTLRGSLEVPLKFTLACLAVCGVLGPERSDGGQQSGEPARLVFEVASVRRNASAPSSSFVPRVQARPGGLLFATRAPLTDLIRYAYGLENYQEIIGDHPELEEFFDITARAPRNAPPLLDDGRQSLALMLQSLLAERFNLRVRWEDRIEDVLVLTTAREDGQPGPGLHRSNCVERGSAAAKDIIFDAWPPLCDLNFTMGNTMKAGGETMADLARNLARGYVKRQVIDRTGLPGEFDIEMTFDAAATAAVVWGPQFGAPSPDRGPNELPSEYPSLATALEEQLGLKLESRRENVPALIVEHVGPLIEN